MTQAVRQPAWSGIYPATLTMFDRRGRLDRSAMAEHVDRLVHGGADGIIVAGTSGEFISLDRSERLSLIELVTETVHGRVPVIAGTGTAATASTIVLTREAAAMGVAGVIVILPFFQRPALREVTRHLEAVGRTSPVPVMVYNNPANSGAPALRAHDLASLYHAGHASAVKSTFPSVHQVHETIAATDGGFRVFYGSFMAPLEALAGGAHGWISGILNVVLGDALELWAATQASDLVRARAAWSRILPIRSLYTSGLLGPASDLAIYRAVLRLRGEPAGYCRKPLLDLDARQVQRLKARLLTEA